MKKCQHHHIFYFMGFSGTFRKKNIQTAMPINAITYTDIRYDMIWHDGIQFNYRKLKTEKRYYRVRCKEEGKNEVNKRFRKGS